MIESLSVVIWGCGGMECGKKTGALSMRYGDTFASDGYVPFFDCVGSFMGIYIYISELSQIMFFKYVQSIMLILF